MLAVIGVLLIFFVIVRRKWREAMAKKEEILRLVAMASEEEAEISKRERECFDFESPPPSQLSEIQQRYYCAVCLSPTTTRCSQCKAVRYCSGKCQIIHWRKGHKYECRHAIPSRFTMGNECFVPEFSGNQGEMLINDEVKHLAADYGAVNFKTSSDSFPSFSSSPEQSEESIDASSSEFHDSDSPVGSSQTSFDRSNSQFSESTDSDVVDPHNQSVQNGVKYVANRKRDEIKKTLLPTHDDALQLTSAKIKKTDAAMLEDAVLERSELRGIPPYSSIKTSSLSETQRNQALAERGDAMKSFYHRGSGKRQVTNKELKNPYSSRSASIASSIQHWKNEAQISSAKEERHMLFKSSGNDQADSMRSFISETEPKPNNKALKTLRKFAENFKASKQSNSYVFDIGKNSTDIYNQQVLVLPKIFPHLYSFNSVEFHPFGLTNCGNSCYANAVLQCLVFTRPLASYFLQGLHSNTCRKKDWCLVCEFEHLTRKGQGTNYPLSPVRILSQVKRIGSHLSVGKQEDAHDFLRNVVEKMQCIWLEEAGFSGTLAEDSTLLGLSFGGYLQSKIKCMKCSGRSEQCDRVMDLAVEITGNIYSLEEALAQFTVSETLSGDDKYKCSRCKSYEKAKKKLTVAEAPNILTIVLKRFKSGNSEKLNKFVRFPKDLDLTPYMSSSDDQYPLYNLYAVVVHLNMMNDSYSGHYISYVKDFKGAWYKVDDSKVSHVGVETVLSAEAYMLFYARHAVRIHSFVLNGTMHPDCNTKMSSEAPSARNMVKNKISKSKQSSQYSQHSGKHPYLTETNDFFGNSRGDNEELWHSTHRNPGLDSSTDNASIFSTSDSGSYSTDSTKDSEISGYIFHKLHG